MRAMKTKFSILIPWLLTLFFTQDWVTAEARRQSHIASQVVEEAFPIFRNIGINGLEKCINQVTDRNQNGELGKVRTKRRSHTQKDEEDYEEEKEIELERKRRERLASKREQDKIESPKGYSIYEVPKLNEDTPIPLYLKVTIISILDLDELQETVQMDILFTVMWTDFKILALNAGKSPNSSDPIYGFRTFENLTEGEINASRIILNNPRILDSIWKPNLFIENLLSVTQPAIMARPLTIKFIPEVGWFEYSTRITVKLECGFDFHYYPADTQRCDFSVRGFSYTQKDLRLHWFKSGAYLDDISLPSFDLRIEWTNKTDWRQDSKSEEVFDLLKFRILARRRLSYHAVQTYMASTFYIIITSLSFLLPSRLIEARIGMTMTTLLTLTAMFASVRESTPQLSYVKAIDYFMISCIWFVFLTLCQYTVVTWLKGKESQDEKPKKSFQKDSNPPNGKSQSKSKMIILILEKYSFPIFISMFAIYTIIYWSWLLGSADYFNWKINETLNNIDGH